jgi:hypothetical protein
MLMLCFFCSDLQTIRTCYTVWQPEPGTQAFCSSHLGLQHVLSYRYQHTSGYSYSTSSHTGTNTPRATTHPLIQVSFRDL